MADWRETAEALALRRGRRNGPVAAALRGLAALGLGVNAELWTGVVEAPLGWRPAEHTVAESVQVLLRAWHLSQWKALARRRPAFSHLQAGADEWATTRLLRSGNLAGDSAAALRVVLAGGVITEKVARRWSGRPPRCPHCELEDEDAEHRHWRCPAWASARAEATGTREAAQLRRSVSNGVALTGILPARADLQGLALQAAAEDPQLPQVCEGLRGTVFSDGACVHPTDPLLARAAWGLQVSIADGGQLTLGGPVGGQQTAQRAELTAALAAVCAVPGDIDLVSDSRFVVSGVAAIAAGAQVEEWRHSDLWTSLAPHARSGRLRARWTPAHLSKEEYAARGLPESDRVGNAAADAAAGAAAAARAPPADLVAARAEELSQLEAVQRVLAATELAALRANHNWHGAAPPRVRRRWGAVRRAPRRTLEPPASGGPPRQHSGRRSVSAPPGLWQPPTEERVRSLFSGRAWLPHVAAQPRGT